MNREHRIREWTKYTELKNEQSAQNQRMNKVLRIKQRTKCTELKSEQSIQN